MTAPEASIALLLAQQRSGTHLLRSILGRTRRIAALSEICNATAAVADENERSFFKFRRTHLLDSRNSPYPTSENQQNVINQYFKYLLSLYPNHDFVLCDVKYSHVHNFNMFNWDLSEPPFLLRYARKNQIKILHLVRENIFQTALSSLYAAQSGVWRASRPDQVKRISITVDREVLGRRINEISKAVVSFDDWLRGCVNLRITYEDLCGLTPEVPLRKISRFFGLDQVIPFPFKPGFVKTTPPYEECIVNWSEIADLGAGFGGDDGLAAVGRPAPVRRKHPGPAR
jgi:hypothetical protein